ncbi:cGMP-dependent protein kinase [Aureococcus anophagefferens]|nr:cGMP-dependent protein kinase [Aureococcus anophagefferens]
MPQRSAAEQRKVDRKKLKKLYDDWYDYYAATDNGKRQIKREEQNSLSNNLHKKLEARRGDALRPATKKQKVGDLVAQAAAAKEKTHAAEQKTRDDAKRQKVIDLSASVRSPPGEFGAVEARGRLEKQAVAAEEDTPAAQKRRWTEARTARTLLELEEYLEDELCGGGPDHVFLRFADELAVLHGGGRAGGVADLTARVQAAEEDTPAAQQRRWRRAATATHKALADELAVLLDDEDADEDDVADLTARVRPRGSRPARGTTPRALGGPRGGDPRLRRDAEGAAGEILEARASAVVDYCLQEIRAGRRVYIGNARYAQMLKEAKCVPRRKCFAVKGPRGGAPPWDRFFFKSFDRIAETVVGNVAEKYAMNLLANHEDALGDTGLYVLSLEPRATDTTRPSRYILGREVKFSAEFEAELKEAVAAGMPASARKGDLGVYMQDFSAEGPKFKWGSSAVARAKAQAKIDEKSVKGNYVVVGSDSWV